MGAVDEIAPPYTYKSVRSLGCPYPDRVSPVNRPPTDYRIHILPYRGPVNGGYAGWRRPCRGGEQGQDANLKLKLPGLRPSDAVVKAGEHRNTAGLQTESALSDGHLAGGRSAIARGAVVCDNCRNVSGRIFWRRPDSARIAPPEPAPGIGWGLDWIDMSSASQHPIRVLVAKPGLDGHDRGAKVIARALRDAGMEVIYTGIRQTPQMVVQAAAQEDVAVLGLSILSGAHMELMPEIMRLLREQNMDDVLVILGGIVPEEDREPLAAMGVSAVFGPGTSTNDIVAYIAGNASAPAA